MNATQDYLSEQVVYGGLLVSRGAMIADLQRTAAATNHPNPDKLVEAYLRGARSSSFGRPSR